MTGKRVQIIDYQLGNLFSIRQACHHVGLEATITSSADSFHDADALILPGVGAFGNAMDRLNELQLAEPIKNAVLNGKPLLGICLGMQLLFDTSEEFGNHEGLGIIPGQVKRLPTEKDITGRSLRVPNVGWRAATFQSTSPESETTLKHIDNNTNFYFVHSYYAEPTDSKHVLMSTEYGQFRYCSAVGCKHILATQFHPEKSAGAGLKLFANWAEAV
ncbi:imidazole glycerol phosphate synthase subunit HisH [Neorhodopirellula lusitana]|uniref:imidazole glycerol phosphate synthase subunit HisH n=1 Tax=Neorhodopirellula lusitana TaxID=445327 RepID=UPI003850BB8C